MVEVADHQERLLMLAALAPMAPDGEAIFLVADGFFERDAWRALPRLGYTASAVIALPRRSLAPMTSISTSLLVVGRSRHEQLFIAQLDEGDADVILDNLRERRAGATPELGRLVDAATFRSVAAHTGSERVHAWALRVGLTSVTLADLCEAINTYNRRDGTFPEATNAVTCRCSASPASRRRPTRPCCARSPRTDCSSC